MDIQPAKEKKDQPVFCFRTNSYSLHTETYINSYSGSAIDFQKSLAAAWFPYFTAVKMGRVK